MGRIKQAIIELQMERKKERKKERERLKGQAGTKRGKEEESGRTW